MAANARKPIHKARQQAKAPRKLPTQPRGSQNPPAGLKSARKPTPKAPAPAPKAKASPPAPRQAPKVGPPLPAVRAKGGHPAPGKAKASVQAIAPIALPVEDPFDTKPTAYIPGVYTGWIRKKSDDGVRWEAGHTCIAYRRTEFGVSAIMAGQPIKLQEWTPKEFDHCMKPVRLFGKPYPVERAVSIHLKSLNGWTDKALKALKQLKEGKDVDINGEDSLEDILSIERTDTKKVRRQGLSDMDRKAKRKHRRQQRLAAMTPKARKEWQDKRTARRKARKLERQQARAKAKGG